MSVNDRYVVIGNPIAHSKSPQLHARFAEQTSQSIEYERLLAPLDAFDQTLKSLIASGGHGANVTVPFKLDAFRAATQLSPRARAAEAVNTLRFDSGEIFGDNTDGVGLVRDISHNAKLRSLARSYFYSAQVARHVALFKRCWLRARRNSLLPTERPSVPIHWSSNLPMMRMVFCKPVALQT
jgi:Shikimate dehydrogenase substrate binding domain